MVKRDGVILGIYNSRNYLGFIAPASAVQYAL